MRAWIWLCSLALLLLVACGAVEETGGSQEEAVEKQPVEEAVQLNTTLDVEQKGSKIVFTIKLRNESLQDITLPFGSGQKYEIIVQNEQGEEVYVYSADKMFTMALEMVDLKAGETLEWQEEWDLAAYEQVISPGTYKAMVEVMVLLDSEELKETIDPEQLKVEKEFVIEAFDETEEEGASAQQGGYSNEAFQNVVVEGERGHYRVTGLARVFEGSFMYAVSDGHNYLLEEAAMIKEGDSTQFSPFELEINIPEENLPENGTLTLELFVYSAKDGTREHDLIIPLESFK